MSDEAAFVTTIVSFVLCLFVAWLMTDSDKQGRASKAAKRWLLTMVHRALGGAGAAAVRSFRSGDGKTNNGNNQNINPGPTTSYGAVYDRDRDPSVDRAHTLNIDRYGTADPNEYQSEKKDPVEGKKEKLSLGGGALDVYAMVQENEANNKPKKEEKRPKKPRIHYAEAAEETADPLLRQLPMVAGNRGYPQAHSRVLPSWWTHSEHMLVDGGHLELFETFFMAMFVFCSGFLSKGEMNHRRAKRYLFRVWIPFVLINFINRGVDNGWQNWLNNFPSFTNAYDTSWFLACVIQWRMLVTFFSTMTPSGRLGVALILSWFSGYFFTQTPTFHLAETLSFLPFYLAGHLVTGEHVKLVKKKWIQRAAIITSAVFFLSMMIFSYATFSGEETVEYGIRTFEGQREAFTIFTYSGYIKGWQRCHYFTTNVVEKIPNYWIVWCHRVVYQMITWIMGLAFILMIPHEKRFYTESGGYTIYPYLLQIFFFALERNFIRSVTGHGVVPSSNIIGWLCIILSIPFVNLLLSSYWCRKCWWIVFEPSWLDWLLFDSPNKTLSPFTGNEVKLQTAITPAHSVRGVIVEVATKEKLKPQYLEVIYKGKVVGDTTSRQTLEEATDYKLKEVKSLHLETKMTSLFHRKRRIKVNEDPGYGWMDFIFSVTLVVGILVLIAMTKRSVAPTPTTPIVSTNPPTHDPTKAPTHTRIIAPAHTKTTHRTNSTTAGKHASVAGHSPGASHASAASHPSVESHSAARHPSASHTSAGGHHATHKAVPSNPPSSPPSSIAHTLTEPISPPPAPPVHKPLTSSAHRTSSMEPAHPIHRI
eukprot:CAMPEP_0114536134 /NCGR_PEP_ID=MMETSP0109-20121206/28822_1 /TAXON_ID=29199 /ORGANISM="Chlorarachnion reptans, Strain CCCM449" /LENGTH=815 /DNA_ID=CAMNT_0001719815 /DNA_START=74 /DNA_END=2522 /DNA_ORIENTATION=-